MCQSIQNFENEKRKQHVLIYLNIDLSVVENVTVFNTTNFTTEGRLDFVM